MDSDIGATFLATFVARRLLMDEVYGSTNAILEFIELSGTNYKFLDKKNALAEFMNLYFQSYGPKWYKLQVDRPKNAVLEFMDLNGTPLQVGGPLVHYTHLKTIYFWTNVMIQHLVLYKN